MKESGIDRGSGISDGDERYLALARCLSDGVVVHQPGRVLFANPAALRLFGVGAGEELSADDLDRLVGAAGSAEATLTTRDGRKLAVHITASPVRWNGERATQAVLRDVSERKRAEEALRTAKARIEAILDNFPYLVWLKDTEGRFVAVNRPFATACGKASPLDVVGKTDFDVWPANLAQRYRTDDVDVMSSRKKKLVEEPIADGGRVAWFETFKTPIFDEHGTVVGTTGFARDVTEQKQAVQALLESETRQRALLSAIPDMMFRIRGDGTYLDYSVPDAHALLAPPEAFMGRRIRDVMPPEAARVHEDHITSVITTGEARSYEYPLVMKGETRMYEARMVKSGADEVFSIIRDVTDMKRADAALRSQEQRLQSLVDSAPFGAHQYELRPEGRLVFIGANRSADAILGVSNDRFLGKTIEEAFPDLAKTPLPEAYKRIAAEGGSYEAVLNYDDGGIRGAFDVHAVQTASGRMAVFFRDLTEAQKAEHERRRLEEQFQQAQKMEAVGQLAGGVAHDFNNLLSVIISYSGFVLDQLPPDSPLRADILEVRDAGQRAVGLTRQLLAFSRRQVIEPRDVDVNDAIQTLAKMLRRLIGEHIKLEIATCAAAAVIHVDATQFDQVLTNLAVNARDAMAGGGTLGIKTDVVTLDADFARTHPGSTPGEYVAVTVADSGTGIPADVLPKIFEPFFTTKGVGRGTGLGLAMVYGAMKQNGGYITVASEVGAGTTFTLYFRMARVTAGAAPDVPVPVEPRGAGELVLVVEDEDAVRGAMVRVLKAGGYSVVEAARGVDALAAFKANGSRVALVISDVVMPGMSGVELGDELAHFDPAVKILFCSGYTDEMLDLQGVLKPGRQLISKPVPREVLLEKVREMILA